MKKERRKLIKFSNYSLCVTLPKWVVKELEWAKGDVVDMSVDAKKGTILISKEKLGKVDDAISEHAPSETNLETRW